MKLTAIGDVITALVTTLDAAVTYPVHDGPVSQRANRNVSQYVVIGAEDPENAAEADQPTNSASMQQQWYGLGQAARSEDLHIYCVAVGKSTTVASARALALSAVQDAFTHLGTHPTNETYNALVSEVTAIDSRNVSGGAVVYARFIITASARLV